MNDVAIIGAGPAGIAASIYLKRAGIDVALYEKNEVGGLLLNAHLIENYPGFPNGINGKELCELFVEHLEKWKIKPVMQQVKQIILENNQFIVITKKDRITFKAVILATGTKPQELCVPGEQNLINKLVFYEIKDLLPMIKAGNIVVVIGSGDAAFDYSLNLAENNIFVELFFRSEKPKCLDLLEKRVKKNTKIHLHSCTKIIEIINNAGKTETKFLSIKNNQEIKIKSDYILIACGRNPNKELLIKDFKKSNIPGFYIAGDVKSGRFRQVGIAIGESIQTAMLIESYLRGKKND